MPKDNGELTAAEKHEAARAFALSGTLSKFQRAKQRKKALEAAITTAKAPPPARASSKAKAPKPQKRKQNKNDKNSWPQVQQSDWQYVYIAKGPFAGRFGYYDDQEEDSAVIYFGAPLLGEGPYCVPLEDLRVPPKSYCKDSYTPI
ncbi:expressed unknown protein [Seminavis robusta]|uniref:Uncharacterized protein n=1 Tax=Seminavis robusta TaxID=568900 RepID=A0A9N8EMI9_9STRA|nr:expressed unknown protein [Seminavis robusta]|eukprot:Sro1220_g253480.1 n/a (146) ;mRNA; r:2326-2763